MTKYEAISRALKQQIQEGLYSDGDRLPTEYELMEQYSVSRHTVRQALKQLEFEGLIKSIRGNGTFVSSTTFQRNDQISGDASRRIAVILRYINDYIYPDILKGMQQEMSEHGYSMLLYSTENRVDKERRDLLECLAQNVDGIIVDGTRTARPNPNIDIYRRIQEEGMPLVFLDSWYDGMAEPVCVGVNDEESAARLTRYLQDKGHQRIAAIFKEDSKAGLARYRGYARQEMAAGRTLNDDAVIWSGVETSAMQIDAMIMETLRQYDAVVCYNDQIARQVVDMAMQEGVRIPEDLAVVGFDNTVLCDAGTVRITCVSHPKDRMGIIAAQKLIGLMNGRDEKSIQLEMQFVEGTST